MKATPTGRTMAKMIEEMVAPAACPRSRVVSNIPDANPRCSVGRPLITTALFTVLKMLVPKEIGSSNNGSSQKLTLAANTASNTKPMAMDNMQKVLSNLGLYLSWMFPAMAGSQIPNDWWGIKIAVTKMGDLPRPSSIMIGNRVIVASIDTWNITLDTSDSEKYLCRKCRNSTNGWDIRRSTKMNTPNNTTNRTFIGRWNLNASAEMKDSSPP